MKKYNVLFSLYGGLRVIPIEANSEKDAIEKAKNKNEFLPVRLIECVECQ